MHCGLHIAYFRLSTQAAFAMRKRTNVIILTGFTVFPRKSYGTLALVRIHAIDTYALILTRLPSTLIDVLKKTTKQRKALSLEGFRCKTDQDET